MSEVRPQADCRVCGGTGWVEWHGYDGPERDGCACLSEQDPGNDLHDAASAALVASCAYWLVCLIAMALTAFVQAVTG